MKRFWFGMLVSVYLSLPGWVSAQQVLSLGQCVELALRQNKQLDIARQEYEKARGQITETRANALPNITLNGTLAYQNTQPFFTFPDSSGDNYVKIPVAEKDNYSLNATLRQPIFNASAFIAPQASRIFSQFSEQNIHTVEQSVILTAKSAYFSVLLARAGVDVAQQSLALAQATLDRIRQYRQIGQASDYDVLRAEVETANVAPELIHAQSRYELALLNLKNVLSLDPIMTLTLTDTLAYQPAQIGLADALQAAQANRSDLKAMDYQVKGWHKYVQTLQVSRLPVLTGLLKYDANYDHYKIDGDNWNTQLTGIVSLNIQNIPFLDGGRTAGLIGQGKAEWRKARLMAGQLQDAVRLEISQAILAIEEAAKRVEATQLNIARAGEALKIAELRYGSGQNTQLEVKDARMALTIARTNAIVALHDHNLAKANLDKAMGVLK